MSSFLTAALMSACLTNEENTPGCIPSQGDILRVIAQPLFPNATFLVRLVAAQAGALGEGQSSVTVSECPRDSPPSQGPAVLSEKLERGYQAT